MDSGIYKITNKINNKIYIGRTINFTRRFSQYRYDFKNLRYDHINEYLMNSMLKYGFENFEFSILEICEPDKCIERELYWMEQLNSTDKNFGYNLRKDSEGVMIPHDLTREKISKRLRVEWESGVRNGHSEKLKKSWETRDKVAQGNLFSEILTKYIYKITYQNGDVSFVKYKELRLMGYGNVIAKFHAKQKDKVDYKGVTIERILLNESKT